MPALQQPFQDSRATNNQFIDETSYSPASPSDFSTPTSERCFTPTPSQTNSPGVPVFIYSQEPFTPPRGKMPPRSDLSPARERMFPPRQEPLHQYGDFGSAAYDVERKNRRAKKRAAREALGGSVRKARLRLALQRLAILIWIFGGLLYWVWARLSSPTRPLPSRPNPTSPLSFIRSAKSPQHPTPHPILTHLLVADQKWNNLVASQSKTLSRAISTYQTRYSRPPPAGFRDWFIFAAKERHHALVDEYDSMMKDLHPFRNVSAVELRRRTAELGKTPGFSLVEIRGGVAEIKSRSGRYAAAAALQDMMKGFVKALPDMDIAVNERGGGRVLPPREREEDNVSVGNNTSDSSLLLLPSLKGFKGDWRQNGSVWDTYRRSCSWNASSRRMLDSIRPGQIVLGDPRLLRPHTTRRRSLGPFLPSRPPDFEFNSDLETEKDFCSHPSGHALHSTFFSDQRTINLLYPVFSPSKLSGYADILIPSHHYWSPTSDVTYEWEFKNGFSKAPFDCKWAKKASSIYWRGKLTLGVDTPSGHWESFQQERLVRLMNPIPNRRAEGKASPRVLVAFKNGTDSLASSLVTRSQIKGLSNVAIACDPLQGECVYLGSKGYRVETPESFNEAWKHKYVLDIDGVGASSKFFSLMESKSAVVKSSIQKEFWQDWAVPWKQFIPLSSSYSELFNIQAFFTGLPSSIDVTRDDPRSPGMSTRERFTGDARLKQVAEAGRYWRQRYARKQDLEVSGDPYNFNLPSSLASSLTSDFAS